MAMKHQLMESIKGTAKTLLVAYYYPVFSADVILFGSRFWPSGFLGSRTILPTTYLTYQYI